MSFTRQCDLSLFDEFVETRGADQRFLLGWKQELTEGQLSHVFVFRPQETGLGNDLPLRLRLRLLCHYLLNQIPDEGLPELMESIAEIYEFHCSATSTYAPPKLETRSVRAKRGRVYERPEFSLADE